MADIFALEDICCSADILESTACTAGDDSLLNIKLAINYLVSQCERNLSVKTYLCSLLHICKDIVKVCLQLIDGVGVTWVERHCDHWFDLTEVDLYTAVIVCNVARFQFFIILRSSVDRIEFLDLRICLPDGGKTCGFCCHNINTDTEICA